jgi:hypothetical protein
MAEILEFKNPKREYNSDELELDGEQTQALRAFLNFLAEVAGGCPCPRCTARKREQNMHSNDSGIIFRGIEDPNDLVGRAMSFIFIDDMGD